ncbi:hypothetical protein BCR33DRAFT_579157 [Rhizoclosmatium globosum]|uniref:Uncharacterized protein n=1 Tax=Rhizoclosmatium globosum TaxID=329046 RepID=A0A1Y2B3I4_9FUNG|nr:hypothetical protein BCR33DRAFT_579157 [Rhizoclosmatium globosum]|eukprot:ORY29286.1 hypothetical protein BCR33DRAFT_579157 [Rhizoclosmatium globosum]
MPSSTASHETRATAPATESESGTEESSDIRSDGDYEGELPSQSETRPSNVVVQVVELQPGTITSEQDTVPATSSDQQPQEPLNQTQARTQDQDQDQALPCRWIANGSLCNLVFAEGSHLYDHIVDDHVGRRASKFLQPSALLDCMWQGCPHGTRPFVKRCVQISLAGVSLFY